jgi:carboxyl-terminal processing protease
VAKILKTTLKGVGFISLIVLNLAFFYWIETFHYLGCGFPFLFDFLLVPFLVGFSSSIGTKRFYWRKSLPFLAGAFLYAGGVMVLSGRLRFLGWLRDIGPFLVVWAVVYSLMLYSGRLIRRQTRIPSKWAALAISLVLVLVAVFQFTVPPYARYYYLKDGVLSFFTQNIEEKSYDQALGVICSYLERKYPYFDYKNIDWKWIKSEAEAEVEAVKNTKEFYAVVKKLLDSLDDGHVRLSPATKTEVQALMSIGALGTLIEGRPVVLAVESGSPAEKAGLRPGIEILAVNDKALNRKKFSLYGPRGGHISVAYLDEDQAERKTELDVPAEPWKKPGPPITWKYLPGGYGYIQIKTMAMDMFSFVPAFDRAVEKLWQTGGLIIDIRYNTGGAIVLTDQILGRLTNRRIHYGGMLDREGRYAPLFVVPRRPTYRRPVVILINEWNGSAADFFAYAASHLDCVTLAGRATSGVVSNPSRVLKLPGGARVQLVSSGLADTFRRYVVEDTGVRPDIDVPYSLPDIRAGADRDLSTAIKILQSN